VLIGCTHVGRRCGGGADGARARCVAIRDCATARAGLLGRNRATLENDGPICRRSCGFLISERSRWLEPPEAEAVHPQEPGKCSRGGGVPGAGRKADPRPASDTSARQSAPSAPALDLGALEQRLKETEPRPVYQALFEESGRRPAQSIPGVPRKAGRGYSAGAAAKV